MRNNNNTCFLFLCMVVLCTPCIRSFTLPTSNVGYSLRSSLYSTTAPSPREDVDEMREDIAKMRQEALERLEALNKKMHESASQTMSTSAPIVVETKSPQTTTVTVGASATATPPPKEIKVAVPKDTRVSSKNNSKKAQGQQNKVFTKKQPTIATIPKGTDLNLLDGTRWRLMLNIGREPGTWMPKTWGVSGERLHMTLEIEFTNDPIKNADEFLEGGKAGKRLHVPHNEVSLSPTMKEGSKRLRVADGGWRVSVGDGPMGTDLVRFYFELEEEGHHTGSDVYCPKGRVYCTCGYFPMEYRQGSDFVSLQDAIQIEQHEMSFQYEKLMEENDGDASLWKKLQNSKKMMDLRMQASKLQQRMNEARVKEPDVSNLRMSVDRSVALTKEGGVCCKVIKGVTMEYHILGKFAIASMENREHADYRELLLKNQEPQSDDEPKRSSPKGGNLHP